MVRQNLSLLVDHARPTPLASNYVSWRLTLYGVPGVWRTALGADAHANLIYVTTSAQTPESLAQILVRLHVVRAMKLGINPEWPIFVTYVEHGARDPSPFVRNPNQIPTRFLYPSTFDDHYGRAIDHPVRGG